MAAAAGSISSRAAPLLLPALAGAFSVVVFFCLLAPADADEAAASQLAGLWFRVGGLRGWRVPDANARYSWWAMNNRFRVGDRLYFRYANDSVLLVDRPAFDACNATAPLAAFSDGATTFPLDRPGFFCFISGEPGHCEEGQRLIVRVMVHPALPAAGPALPAAGPASAPGTSEQPGHGGGHPRPSGAATAVEAGVAVAATLAAFASLVLMLK